MEPSTELQNGNLFVLRWMEVSMELGSNCPVIVMNDANIEMAMEACVSGAFWAAGQNCLHVQRIYIQDDIYDQFASEFCLRASKISMGDKLSESTQMGPMINSRAALKVEAMVQDALKKNSTLLCGGKRQRKFFQPTVFANVSSDCLIAKEEVFGPITVLYRFTDKKEAIAQANDVEFGLQAGIFTNDLELAFELADSMDCGGVMINDSSDYRIDAIHPPLARMWAALPLVLHESIQFQTKRDSWQQGDSWHFSRDFIYEDNSAKDLFASARIMAILLGVVMGLLLFFWARELYGYRVAICILMIYHDAHSTQCFG